MRSVRGICVALLVLGACAQAPAPASGQLFTLFDVEALYAAGAPGTQPIADDDGLPGGIPLNLITNGPTPTATLVPRKAWAAGQAVVFLTTEVWANYPRVWTQPAYVPVTLASDGSSLQPLSSPLAPIFSVGPGSGFYSPFWQLVYAQVPAGTAPDSLTSVRQILDGGYPLTPGPGRMMSLTPSGVGLPPGMWSVVSGAGFLDGGSVQYFDFGSSMFNWDPATNVLVPANIYALTFVGADGQIHATPAIWTVLGAAPPGTGVPLPGGGQRNVAFWQVVTVQVPAGARVFAPPQAVDMATKQTLDDILTNAGIDPGSYTPAITGASTSDVAAFAPFYRRVAVNPGDPAQGIAGCFDQPSSLASCIWLDSESALQDNVDLALAQPTAIAVTWEVTAVADLSAGSQTPIPLVSE